MSDRSFKPFITPDRTKIANKFRKDKTDYVIIFVEGDDDVPFWDEIFRKFAPNLPILPRVFGDRPGKKGILKAIMDNTIVLGYYQLVGVDSDYEYLLQEKTEYSKLQNENPFIFQTYTYSIENYWCYCESLEKLIPRICNYAPENRFNFKLFFEKYSQTIFELFIYSFYCRKINVNTFFPEDSLLDYGKEDDIKKISQDYEKISNLCNHKSLEHENNCKICLNINSLLSKIQEKINSKLTDLKKIYRTVDFYSVKEELKALGVQAHNTYLFARGHDILEEVVLKIFKILLEQYEEERIKEIKDQYKSGAGSRIKGYKNSQVKIKDVLKTHYNFFDCSLTGKIKEDIDIFQYNFVQNDG